ncbi:hypothetical protein B7R21_06310 [Subtercola boreus]|uniref:Uncharacterized protein n=1 Tax=Subtercola boreus TaxID=120213 RepID=A0A3E0VY82_9MICO|nr:hypothetical protein [Subtercola boreus]RFA14555.1 hypothetical protein B7R21_06310 [Subtercola boreus]
MRFGEVSEREPEWDTASLNLMLAYQRILADIGTHGQPMSEATDPRSDPNRPGGWHYEANKAPKKDFAAQSIDHAREAFHKKYPDADRAGDLWHARRVEDE